MSDPKVRGVVHLVEATKSYGQKGFRKRLVVLEQDKGRFTNYVPVEFTNDHCDTVDSLNVGDEVEIAYRLNGRKWQKDPQSEVKFFLNAEALSFDVLGGKSSASSSEGAVSGDASTSSANTSAANAALAEADFDDDNDEVPF